MNFNYAAQHQGVLAWDGAASIPVDLRYHVGFAFTFQAIADVGVDTKFKFEAAPPSDADPCLPGVYVPVEEVLTCRSDWGAVPGPAGILIPANTPKGSICTATLPCKPDAFLKVMPDGGEVADVRVIVILAGPK